MNETNLNTVLSTYYSGTGLVDVGNTFSFLGIPGGHKYCGIFYKNIEGVNAKIIEVCAKIVDEGLVEEMTATIKQKLRDKYSDDKMNTFTNSFFENKGDIPEDIRTIAITANIDMGWNQYATGRIYYSISGRGFMISYLTKNVMSFAVKAKNIFNALM